MPAVRGILTKIVINALAIWIATLVIPNVSVEGGGLGRQIGSLVVVGALFGLINTFIKPVVKFFSFPFYLLTLGLFAFIVNALMLEIVDWLSDKIGISFETGPFFWSTLGAAVVETFVAISQTFVGPDDDDD